ncbi:MAG: HTH domain-containing protein [Candidatus Pacearchaeota archaeon]
MVGHKKTKNISLSVSEGTFSSLISKISGNKKNSDIYNLRQILSNEKARLLHTIKAKQPESVYKLAKLLNRDFKAVRHDIKVLENFGLVELIASHKKGRERLKPVVDTDQIIITINI